MDYNNMNKYNVLELFGGCGGLGYGFHKNSFNIVKGLFFLDLIVSA